MLKNKFLFSIVLQILLNYNYYAMHESTKLDTVSIQLPYFHEFQFAGFYAAQAKGFYKEVGLYVKILEKKKNRTSIFSVLTQEANFGVSKEALIRENLEGADVVLLKAIYQRSPFAIITLKKNNIYTPLDLVGKKFMVSNFNITPQLYSMFKNEGIDANKLLLIQHSFDYDDLISGKVDAITGHTTVQPYYIKQKGFEPYCIVPSDYGVDFYGAMLFTSLKEIKENKERVDRFIEATTKGWKYAYDNIQETVNIIWELPTNNPDKPTKDMLLNEAQISEKYVLPNIVEFGYINSERINKMVQMYKEMGIVGNNASLDDFFIYSTEKKVSIFNNKDHYFIAIIVILILVLIFIYFFRIKFLKNELAEKKQKEKINKAFLEATPDLIFRISKDGTYLDINIPQNSDLGIRKEDVIGKKMDEVIPADIAAKSCELINKALSTSQIQFYKYPMTYNNIYNEFETRIVPSGKDEILAIVRTITKEKQQKRELIASEEKYRALFNSAGNAILIMSENRFIACNPKTLEIFKCTEEEIINKSLLKFSPKYQPDNKLSEEKAREKIALCLAGQPQTFEWKHTRYDGGEFDAEVKLTKLVFGDKVRILAIIQDITDSKLKAKALKESEEKFSKIFFNNPIPMLLTDMKNGTIWDCNKSFLKTSEFTRDEIIGKTPIQLDLWKNPDDSNKFVAEIYKNGSISDAYFKYNTKSKKTIHCLVSAEIVKLNERNVVLGTYRVINELLEKDSIIKETQLKFSKVFKLSPTAIVIVSLYDGKIIDINSKGLLLLGIKKEDVVNKTTVELNFWKNKAEREIYLNILKEQGFIKDLETTLTNNEGEIIPCSMSAEIIELNNTKYIIGTLWDLRNVKKKEHELQKALKTVEKLKLKLQKENVVLKQEIDANYNIGNIVTNSDKVKKELTKIQQVANTDSTVLITGETGTGKELFARAIHSLSNRKSFPLITINCASLPPNLIESELFGHEKGAFTGAINQKIGKFELADNTTLFLDEIGEFPIEVQSKLLRVLQEGEFERIGSNKTIKTNARVIAATNRNIKRMVKEGTFRADLFYRLNVFPIKTTPLRERHEDIIILINYFVEKLSTKIGKKITSINKSSINALLSYSFPGNIRELENMIERAIILTNSSSLVIDIPNDIRPNLLNKAPEKETILSALINCNWKIEGVRGAAKMLNIPPSTLRDKIKKYKLKKP